MEDPSSLVFYANGNKISIENPDPRATLIQFLRRNLFLTGTKEACGQGACGACTVMISFYDHAEKKIINYSGNACITPLCSLHGMAITTVEGVGGTRNGLHPIQKNLMESSGLQCGFCTPGMVMTMYTLFRNNPKPTTADLERALEGNLCRCTGYRPILDAFKKSCPCGLGLCQSDDSSVTQTEVKQSPTTYDTTQDVIFPSELQRKPEYSQSSVTFRGSGYTWMRPVSLSQVTELKSKYPDAVIVAGSQFIGSQIRNNTTSKLIICCTHVAEMNGISETKGGISFGASVTFARMEQYLIKKTEKERCSDGDVVHALLQGLRWIGADQLRNIATLGGHLMSVGPHDLQTLMMTCGAELTFSTTKKSTKKVVYEKYLQNGWTGPEPDDILVSVFVPYSHQSEKVYFDKHASRRGMSYAIVNIGLYTKMNKSNTIDDMKICVGNITNKPMAIESTGKVSKGKTWNDKLVSDVCDAIIAEMKGTKTEQLKYKTTLACALFFKFYRRISKILQLSTEDQGMGLTSTSSNGAQFYDVPSADSKDIVWKPIPHVAAKSMTTGEAVFIDDIPQYRNELFLVYVTSTKAHAKIVSVDPAPALAVSGVVDYVTHTDVPGNQTFGALFPETPLFADKEVVYTGQPLGCIIAETREIARFAAKLVKVEYEELPAVFTIDEAIEKKSFHEHSNTTKQGDIENGFAESEVTIEGEIITGAQEHFYLEPQAGLVVPKKEDNEIEVFVATQDPMNLQKDIAHFLAIPSNRINVKVKRIGGAFGGKAIETVHLGGITAVAAWKVNRPVRCIFSRDYDMRFTSKRHGTKSTYKAGFSKDGKVNALSIDTYLNAGHELSVSGFVMEMMMLALAGIYDIPNYRTSGYVCKTNTPSNGAMRGFGAPQGHFIMQSIMYDIAKHLGLSINKVREINMFKEGGTNVYGMVLNDFNLTRCWEDCKKQSKYEEVEEKILKFNKENKFRKRGIAMSPCCMGIGYPPLFINQAGALVNIYTDGSVLLTHGGIDMGQGLHTKMCQVAATVLGVPIDRIYISETSTSSVPNATESGGSFVADLNGGAIMNACNTINDRLKPLRESMPQASWDELVKAAYFSRISLSATGFYKSREVGYDFMKKEEGGQYCLYNSYGTACSVVEIDCLTGEHQILKTDIVMDVGKSLNPAIDVGQIEGGFVMGTGLMTLEQVMFDKEKGRIDTFGPINYKVPGIKNIPREFNVTLLKEAKGGNKTLYSSKGIGEPPLLLGVSVHLALREAVLAARKDHGLTDKFKLECPATPERIRMGCGDPIVKKCESVKEENHLLQI